MEIDEVVHVFNRSGLAAFKRVFEGTQRDETIDPSDPELATPLLGAGDLRVREFRTAKELAEAVLSSIGELSLMENLENTGLWAWFTFVLRDQLFKKNHDGVWQFGEIHRWYPSNPNDYRNARRHRVRMPTLLLKSFNDNANHLLCGNPVEMPKIRDQLTSQMDMLNDTFQSVACALYFDVSTGKLKPGAGGEGPGSPKRLAAIRKQFDVTWDLESLSPEEVLAMLPSEFNRFMPPPGG